MIVGVVECSYLFDLSTISSPWAPFPPLFALASRLESSAGGPSWCREGGRRPRLAFPGLWMGGGRLRTVRGWARGGSFILSHGEIGRVINWSRVDCFARSDSRDQRSSSSGHRRRRGLVSRLVSTRRETCSAAANCGGH